MTSVSVVTIVRDRGDHLHNLLSGVRQSRASPNEVIVVDMGSRPSIEHVVAAHHGAPWSCRIVKVAAAENVLPLAEARNTGAEVASGDRLVFLDVDCIPGPHLIDAYRSAAPGRLSCGPVRYLHRRWQATATALDPRSLVAASEPHPARPIPARDRVDDRYELFWSLSFGIGRDAWDHIGGFDRSFVGYGGEDTDFAFTARQAGVELAWLSQGLAYHQWHPSPSPPVQHARSIVENARRFHGKWGSWPMVGWLESFAALGVVDWHPHGRTIELIV